MGAGWAGAHGSRGARGVVGRFVVCVLAMWAGCVRGQNPNTTSPDPDPGYTLHAYANLVQIPTLVLTSGHESYRGLTPARFSIQIDGGPSFHPKQAHLEGDDPITLALMLDAKHGEAQDLVKAVGPAIDHVRSDLLTSRDHLSVFAFDCTLVRSVDDVPASSAVLKEGVAEALQSPKLHSSDQGSHCGRPLELWDAVATVVGRMAQVPGRRVVVVVSDGVDYGSKNSVDAVRQYATGLSVAIFGMRPSLPPSPVAGSLLPAGLLGEAAMNEGLGLLCNGSGGLLLASSPDPRSVASTFARMVKLLRGRYILEFARPQNGTGGMHLINVTTNDVSAVVRASGVTVPLEDKALRADPHTVPTNSTGDPIVGSRRSTGLRP